MAFTGSGVEYYDELYFWLMKDKSDDLAAVLSVANEKQEAGRVLDLGGGFGRVARYLAELGYEVTVIDKSQKLLDIGKQWMEEGSSESTTNISWQFANISRPLDDLPINWFAIALCMHHTVNEVLENLQGVFDNLAHHLEASGYAIINAIPQGTYEHIELLNWVGSFATPDDADWMVTALSVPGANDALHRLFFFYEQYHEGVMKQRLVRTLDRRVWTTEELVGAASRAGLRQVPLREDWPRLVFQKA